MWTGLVRVPFSKNRLLGKFDSGASLHRYEVQRLCNFGYIQVSFSRYKGTMICAFSGGLGPRTTSKNSIGGSQLLNVNSIVLNMSNYTLVHVCILLIWKGVVKLVDFIVEDWAQVPFAKNSTQG